MRDFISPEIKSYTSKEILELIGPAEGQYGPQYTLTLGLEGEQGPLACGTTITDNDANDVDSTAGSITYYCVWNDLSAETGYRFQGSYSATYVNEDFSAEVPANTTVASIVGVSAPSGQSSITCRVFAHVGHAPSHGSTPISGDVVSNECTATLVLP